MTLKTRLFPCLDVKDGRARVARSALWREDAQTAKNDAAEKIS